MGFKPDPKPEPKPKGKKRPVGVSTKKPKKGAQSK